MLDLNPEGQEGNVGTPAPAEAGKPEDVKPPEETAASPAPTSPESPAEPEDEIDIEAELDAFPSLRKAVIEGHIPTDLLPKDARGRAAFNAALRTLSQATTRTGQENAKLRQQLAKLQESAETPAPVGKQPPAEPSGAGVPTPRFPQGITNWGAYFEVDPGRAADAYDRYQAEWLATVERQSRTDIEEVRKETRRELARDRWARRAAEIAW